jgi:hypothetical protein
LGVGDVGEDFVLEELGEERRTFGSTGGAKSAALAGESNEKLEAALGTNDAGETGFEESAVQVREDGGIPVGFPEAVSSFESLLPQALEGLEVGIEDLIEGAGAGIAGPVSGRRGRCGLGPEPCRCGHTAHAE